MIRISSSVAYKGAPRGQGQGGGRCIHLPPRSAPGAERWWGRELTYRVREGPPQYAPERLYC
jgi:hypothetical protein